LASPALLRLSNNSMRIAVDAMGGDFAPREIVLGSVAAARRDPQIHIILVGDEAAIRAHLPAEPLSNISIRHTTQVVGMAEQPSVALRTKRESSLAVATQLHRDGEAEACLSAGNTGAATAFALFILRKIEGIDRAGIATVFPSQKRPVIVIDVGANVDSRPRHLADFAIMGAAYVPAITNIIPGEENRPARASLPQVGVLSIGEEESKGNELSKAAYSLIKGGAANGGYEFFGNVEGRDIGKGTVDVVVCDGFVGNVVLKVAEGCANMITSNLKQALLSSLRAKVGAWLLRPALQKMRLRLDYNQYGGAVLLGVNGTCVICHGSAKSDAIDSAIRIAKQAVAHDVSGTIRKAMLSVPAETAS